MSARQSCLRLRRSCVLIVLVVTGLAAAVPASAQVDLTGINLFITDTSGNYNGQGYANTDGTDNISANLYVITGGLGGPFINHGNDSGLNAPTARRASRETIRPGT